MEKTEIPLADVYRLIEPGPVVLLATRDRGHSNVMALSWHTMLEFEPPLIGCVVSNRDYSYAALRKTKECTVNIPAANLLEKVIFCGNTSGRDLDKFGAFGLTERPSDLVSAPSIEECYASLECKVVDTSRVSRYGFFVLEVLRAKADLTIEHPTTLHHCGRGVFMTAGKWIKTASKMP